MPDLSTITPVTREEEFLDRIARAAASPNLPEVDASDNGDVLTVVDGEWAAAAPAGGLPEVTSINNGQVLTVVSGEWAAAAAPAGTVLLTIDENDQINASFNDIVSYMRAGKLCIVLVDDGETPPSMGQTILTGALYDNTLQQYAVFDVLHNPGIDSPIFVADTATENMITYD